MMVYDGFKSGQVWSLTEEPVQPIFFVLLSAAGNVHALVFRVQPRHNNSEGVVRLLRLVLSPVAEAETVEGLLDVLIGLRPLSCADTEDSAVRNLLLQLSLAEDHSALVSGSPRTRQLDVGSVAPALQQRG